MDERVYKKYFIGQSKPGNWVSVYAYKPHSHDIRVLRGEIFAVISLIGPETFAVSTAGNLILDNLHEMYFENKDDSALIALEKAIKGASNYLQKLLENDKAGDIGIDLDISAVTILGDIVYYVSFGTNCLKVWRDGKATDITTLLKDPTGEGIVKVGSMVAKEGDVFFLTTEQFQKEIHEDEFEKLAESFSDIPLKQVVFNDESKIAMMMLGYDIDFEALKQPKIHPVKEHRNEELIDDNIQDENSEDDQIDVIVDETPQEDEHETDQIIENEEDVDDFLSEEKQEDEPLAVPVVVKTPKQPIKFKNPLPRIGSFFSSIVKKPKTEAYKYEDEDEVKRPVKSALKNVEEPAADEEWDKDEKEEENIEEEKITPQAKIVSNSINEKPTIVYYLAKLWAKIKGFGVMIWEDWLGMGKGSTYLKGPNKNRRWGFLFIVLIVVGGMIYFSVQDSLKNQQIKSTQIDAQKYINEASDNLDALEVDAKTIAKNNVVISTKNTYLEKLNTIKTGLDRAKDIPAVATEYQVQADRVIQIGYLINKTIGVTSPTLLTDMGAKNPGSTLSDMTIGNKLIYFTDSKYGKIYSLSYDGKTDQEVATGLVSPYTLTYNTADGSVLFLDNTTDRKLGIVNLSNQTIQRVAGTSENKLGGVTQIAFFQDSKTKAIKLFAIDPVKPAVYALTSTGGSGFGLPTQRNITMPELSTVKDIYIMDGKVYLLLAEGQGINRTMADVNDTPEIVGLDPAVDDLTNATAFYIDDVYLYIADPTTKSIYILKKNDANLTFVAKYIYTGTDNYFSNIKSVTADRSSGKIFVLDGSRIFSLSMSDLSNFLP